MEPNQPLRFAINCSPHVKAPDTVAGIMRWVMIALAPALAFGILIFGLPALLPVIYCVAACMATEALIQRWRGQPVTISDGSAAVTGILLAAVCPANISWWNAVVGSVFAIAIAKQAFGGLGFNIWNPALLARAFLQVSAPSEMMSPEWPRLCLKCDGLFHRWLTAMSGTFSQINATASRDFDVVASASTPMVQIAPQVPSDIITGATTMARMHFPASDAAGNTPAWLTPSWSDVLNTWLGFEGGSMGETSAVLLILGGLLLIWKKIVSWEMPVIYIGVVALFGWALPHPYVVSGSVHYTGFFQGPWLMHVGGGGLMLGAFFMATDMVTCPLTRKGKIIFACGCGILTILIRLFSGYPEGVCYAILFMNTLTPAIDSITRPRVFGTGAAVKEIVKTYTK